MEFSSSKRLDPSQNVFLQNVADLRMTSGRVALLPATVAYVAILSFVFCVINPFFVS